jgi:ribosome assembly protein YihI (activator of Der GTPase)
VQEQHDEWRIGRKLQLQLVVVEFFAQQSDEAIPRAVVRIEQELNQSEDDVAKRDLALVRNKKGR